MYLNGIDTQSSSYRSQINPICRFTELGWLKKRDVVFTNNDTLNAITWLDLRTEPMVISLTEINDRYYFFLLFDRYTFDFANINRQKVRDGRVEISKPGSFSLNETCDIGRESGSPVSPDYGPRGNAFNGEVNWVEIDVDKDALDQDHFLTGEERFKVALALQ